MSHYVWLYVCISGLDLLFTLSLQNEKVPTCRCDASILPYAGIFKFGVFQSGIRFVHTFGSITRQHSTLGYYSAASIAANPDAYAAEHRKCRPTAFFNDKHFACSNSYCSLLTAQHVTYILTIAIRLFVILLMVQGIFSCILPSHCA